MASIWQEFVDFLESHQADPTTFLVTLFLFSILSAVVLPIPIESALVFTPSSVPIIVAALVLGLGKGVGAMAVFVIGAKVEKAILSFKRWGWFRWLLNKSEVFVRRFGYVALYLIMSVPFMSDTIPLYVFSLLNKEGKLMKLHWFALVNVAAGTTRGLVFLIVVHGFEGSLF